MWNQVNTKMTSTKFLRAIPFIGQNRKLHLLMCEINDTAYGFTKVFAEQ
jgi:hypothetical protein